MRVEGAYIFSSMWFKPISLHCECGAPLPGRIRQLGFTPEHEWVVRWWCPGCKRNHQTIMPLWECWRDSSSGEEDSEVPEPITATMRDRDAKFLHALGVRFPDGEES